ncbi:type I methionyl aminopeptidase [uncultured Cetobacterium sp.]|uniref:type I methionyl aminopeptidase n=1 Tax=uncultured Cetobacterium sp. TaxID=527638 RepID=UPI0026274144|nr:type I methionyl aminopeptidase [uncultured Cetobacterium sp.]
MLIIKTLEEIKEIKKPSQIIAKLYDEVLPKYIKAGISTGELNNIIEDYLRSNGAEPATIGVGGPINPYPAGSCISVNEEVVHGIPRMDKIIKDGDIVSVDVVARMNGFYGDSAITYGVGEIDAESQKLIDVTKKSREIGIEEMVAGNRLGDVGNAVQKYVESNGFSVVKDFAGHGVGKAMHEDPCIPNFGRKGRGIKIEDGMVLALEPMVNVGTYKISITDDDWTVVTRDGKRSAHFEHTVAIVGGKPIILTQLD